MLWKYFIQYTSKFGKLSSGHRTGKISFYSNLKERQCQGMFKLPHNCIHSHTSKLMLKILEARLQQYTNCQLPDVQAGLRKGREPEVTLPTSVGSYKKSREFQKNITSSIIPFSSCLHLSQYQGLFQCQLFSLGDQTIGASASASVLPMNIQDWFPWGFTGLISFHSKWFSRVFCNTTVQNINSLMLSLLYGPILTSIHAYWKKL